MSVSEKRQYINQRLKLMLFKH